MGRFSGRLVSVLAAGFLAAGAHAEDTKQGRSTGRIQKCTYVSSIDGAAIDYALWFPPEYDPSKPWPMIVFLHGSNEGGSWSQPFIPEAGIPVRTEKPDLPFMILAPLMRGTWAISGAAEADVMDTIADAQTRANIDPDRIHLSGLSLGGFAGWAVAAHYPDRFASLSAFCGGGEPELAGNLRNLPVWVFHGAADRNVLPYESERMVNAMQAAKLPVRFTKIPGTGHVCWRGPYAGDDLYGWMSGLTRVREPSRITYRTFSLRHNRAYWAEIGSMVDPASSAMIDVFVPGGAQVHVHAENVGRLILRPPAKLLPPDTTPTFFSDGKPIESEKLSDGWTLNLADPGDAPLSKRHGLSGPIQDVFWDSFVVVTPSGGDPRVVQTWEQVARGAFKWADKLTFQSFRFMAADEITPEVIESSNLICVGNPGMHEILTRVADRLPLAFTPSGLVVAGQPGSPEIAGFVMVYPNPLNPQRYLVACSGHPQAVAALAKLAFQPPYLSPTPIEDLLVITRNGQLPLSQPPPAAPAEGRSMAAPIPPRGVVFDRHWQLPPEVVSRLRAATPVTDDTPE